MAETKCGGIDSSMCVCQVLNKVWVEKKRKRKIRGKQKEEKKSCEKSKKELKKM